MKSEQERAREQAEAKQEAEAFMRAVREGEQQKRAAFDRVARKYHKPLIRHIQFGWGRALEKLGKSAEDYATDAFVKLWKSILSFDNRNGRGLFPYINRIATNAILSDLRSPLLELVGDVTNLAKESPADGASVVVSREESGRIDAAKTIEGVRDPNNQIETLELSDCMDRVTEALEREAPILAAIVRLLRNEEEHADIAQAVGVDPDNFRKYYLFKTRQKVVELRKKLC